MSRATKKAKPSEPAVNLRMVAPSVQERLEAIERATLLCLHGLHDDEDSVDMMELDPEVVKAMRETLRDASMHAYWLKRKLNDDVLSLPVPDDELEHFVEELRGGAR